MRIKNWTFTYALGYTIVYHGVRTFYKRQQVVGKENLPTNKPILFASNHQNAFMDPVVIAVPLNKPAHYMVRADIFKNPSVAKILRAINMMPIFRQRDGGNTIKKNEQVFDHCYDLLKDKKPIVIFVEGNQGKQKRLRPIQKGVFRIGLKAEEKYNNELDVHIVPVGLYYSDTINMGAKMIVNYGKPIRLQDYLAQYKENEAAALNNLKDELGKRMNTLMIDIQNTEYYDTIHEMMFAVEKDIFEKEKKAGNKLIDEFNCQKRFIDKTENWIENNPEEATELKENVENFTKGLDKLDLKSWLLYKEKNSTFLPVLLLIIGLPIHLYGIINSYIPYKIPAAFVQKKVKDVHFHSSIKMAVGVLLFWIFWAIQTVLVSLFTDNYIWVYYLASLPLTAWISYHYWILLLKTAGTLRFNKLQKAQDKSFLALQENHAKIKKFLAKIYAGK